MGQSNTKLEQFREYLGLNLVQNTPHFRASPLSGPLVGKYWTLGLDLTTKMTCAMSFLHVLPKIWPTARFWGERAKN